MDFRCSVHTERAIFDFPMFGTFLVAIRHHDRRWYILSESTAVQMPTGGWGIEEGSNNSIFDKWAGDGIGDFSMFCSLASVR